METQKRTKLLPEQLKENIRTSKDNWQQNDKDYFQKYMIQKTTCECGHTITYSRHQDHLKSKIHEKLMNVVNSNKN